jgi:3-isopropylmalate dehydratase small subunit
VKSMNQSNTLIDKLWATHEIVCREDGESLLWVDRHYVHEGSFHAFSRLTERGIPAAEPQQTFTVTDHYVPTRDRRHLANPEIARMVRHARNFGCGSSREAAVYALYDYGIRCVIAPSFGDISSGNAVQNGLLTAMVSDEQAAEIMAALIQAPGLALTVDLAAQTILCGHRTHEFSTDPVSRTRLLNGWDDIALTQSYRDRSAAFKTANRTARPWSIPHAG